MAATTLRLCGIDMSVHKIHVERLKLERSSRYYNLLDVAIALNNLVRNAEGILEVVSKGDPRDVRGKVIEPWIVKRELEALCEDLSKIIDIVNKEFEPNLPSNGTVPCFGRNINIHQLRSVLKLQKSCMAAQAENYAKL